MSWFLFRSAALALAGLLLNGCGPYAQSPSDEEKESHFLAGKSRVSTMDYRGAIESFERALEVNPHSAAAHFELGCLFDEKEADPAAAIYHYEHYLKLRPEAGNADIIKQRIMTCKQELARNVSLGPLTERQQREFEQLAEENKKLTEQVKRLTDDLEKWRAFATRAQALTNQATQPSPRLASLNSSPATTSLSSTSVGMPPVAARTHTVKSGETLTIIAHKYGVRLEALTAANPRIDARRLQVGQLLTIPGS